MEGNKDEAERCIQLAHEQKRKGDTEAALKFLQKAERLYPSNKAKGTTKCSFKVFINLVLDNSTPSSRSFLWILCLVQLMASGVKSVLRCQYFYCSNVHLTLSIFEMLLYPN